MEEKLVDIKNSLQELLNEYNEIEDIYISIEEKYEEDNGTSKKVFLQITI